jgi:3-dehydro-L-gulonate 2-dehydrogenase
MAMSQFSYGALASYAKRGEPLPLPGGFDEQGRPTQDAAAIEASQRPFPIGYWKGSGLSLVLDMMAAMLSGGLATYQLPLEPTLEAGQSQIFLAIDPSNVASTDELNHIADDILQHLHDAKPEDPSRPVRYPGEQTLHVREENMRLGIPVDPELWQRLSSL